MQLFAILVFFHFHSQSPFTNCYNFATINLTDYSSTIQCVNKIAAKHFGQDTIFTYEEKYRQAGEDFLKNFQNFPVTLSHENKFSEENYHSPNFIVFSNNATYIKHFLRLNRRHFNSRSTENGDKHIFVELEHESFDIVKILYELLISKFVIVTKNNEVLWYDLEDQNGWFPNCTPNFANIENQVLRNQNCEIEQEVRNNN